METFLKWIEINGGDLKTIDPSLVYYKKRVCSLHFVNNDISPGTNSKLKAIAFPTLHIPGKFITQKIKIFFCHIFYIISFQF